VGVPAPSSCRLYLVIAALSNRSQTNLAAFPALNCIENSMHGAISTRNVRPSERRAAPAAGNKMQKAALVERFL
jgi:hypothetical protein